MQLLKWVPCVYLSFCEGMSTLIIPFECRVKVMSSIAKLDNSNTSVKRSGFIIRKLPLNVYITKTHLSSSFLCYYLYTCNLAAHRKTSAGKKSLPNNLQGKEMQICSSFLREMFLRNCSKILIFHPIICKFYKHCLTQIKVGLDFLGNLTFKFVDYIRGQLFNFNLFFP